MKPSKDPMTDFSKWADLLKEIDLSVYCLLHQCQISTNTTNQAWKHLNLFWYLCVCLFFHFLSAFFTAICDFHLKQPCNCSHRHSCVPCLHTISWCQLLLSHTGANSTDIYIDAANTLSFHSCTHALDLSQKKT